MLSSNVTARGVYYPASVVMHFDISKAFILIFMNWKKLKMGAY
jgi:hypothetical protein